MRLHQNHYVFKENMVRITSPKDNNRTAMYTQFLTTKCSMVL